MNGQTDKQALPKHAVPIGHAAPVTDSWSARQTAKADTFPDVEQFERADAVRAIELLDDDLHYSATIEATEKARKAGKEELTALAAKYGVEGMRWRAITAYVGELTTRRALSKERLVENGVPVEVIEASFVESAPFRVVRVVDTSKGKGGVR